MTEREFKTPESHRLANARWRVKNRELTRGKAKAYYQANKDRIRKDKIENYQKNIDPAKLCTKCNRKVSDKVCAKYPGVDIYHLKCYKSK